MIQIEGLSKTFRTSDGTVEALKNVSLTVNDGDIYGIIGMSGAGKSTLVRCINLLERPTEGTVRIDGQDLCALSEPELRTVRREISMIFQSFNLLAQRTCLKNICFPLELIGVKKAAAEARARELLELVGLPDKADAYPSQLSGGQKQRIAIARALATDPKVLLCDEATSALDPKTTHDILSLLRELHAKLGITILLITHQMSVVEEICTRVAILDNGSVVEEGPVESVFSAPKSAAAKRLVFPDGYEELPESETPGHRIRVVFRGTSSATAPLIARMAIEEHILANILAASIKSISGKEYGSMVLEVADADECARALAYLAKEPDLVAEEVNLHA
ncbi:MAG: ATP-binding cassette domain-containing protein [Clostridia bacterium]|nr:ATP-binding cassette domain-containing protein [Clostridia bacterium]